MKSSLSENHEFIGFFLNEKLEYILVFHKVRKFRNDGPNK